MFVDLSYALSYCRCYLSDQPLFARSIAVSLPIPVLAPVMSTVFPSSFSADDQAGRHIFLATYWQTSVTSVSLVNRQRLSSQWRQNTRQSRMKLCRTLNIKYLFIINVYISQMVHSVVDSCLLFSFTVAAITYLFKTLTNFWTPEVYLVNTIIAHLMACIFPYCWILFESWFVWNEL